MPRKKKLTQEEIDELYPREREIRDYSKITPGFVFSLFLSLIIVVFTLIQLGVITGNDIDYVRLPFGRFGSG